MSGCVADLLGTRPRQRGSGDVRQHRQTSGARVDLVWEGRALCDSRVAASAHGAEGTGGRGEVDTA